MPCSYEHLWPLILPNVLVFFRIFTLSDHAARKSGTRGEIREDDFSDGITGCLGCLAAQTSGVKNNASALFFTLSSHAARKSGTRGEIREDDFSDGITGCLGCLAAQTSGVKNNTSALFFTLPPEPQVNASALQAFPFSRTEVNRRGRKPFQRHPSRRSALYRAVQVDSHPPSAGSWQPF